MLARVLLAWFLHVAQVLHPAHVEHQAFYHPRSGTPEVPARFEEVWFHPADGVRLHAWFLPAKRTNDALAPVVIHAHGNSGHLANHLGVTEFVTETGCHVLLFDYRGFGRSDPPPQGMLRRRDLVADTVAAIDYAVSREDVDAERVAVFGCSLGATMVLAAAAEREHVDAVVTYAGFTSWQAVASDHAGPLGIRRNRRDHRPRRPPGVHRPWSPRPRRPLLPRGTPPRRRNPCRRAGGSSRY